MTPQQILNDYFGYTDFRKGQKEIIDAILGDKSVLAVMPTGSGKSLCYQIPALVKGEFSIVISPLNSLMQDQVDALNKIQNNSAFINSSLDYSQTQKVLQNIAKKKINLLYLAPEKLSNPEFVSIIKNYSPYFLFVDEAHCISQWGHNFRPSYRNIRNFADAVGIKNISAFTATATPDVRDDIIEQLGFKDPSIFVYGFERENISLNVIHTKKKKEEIIKIISENKSSAIIYAATRKYCEDLAKFLKLNNINAEYYHAGLSTELRRVIQDDFLNDNIRVIVATNAFGMGIDKKDIDLVIHYNIPGSIENLYQEFGRAGRDGREAKNYLMYSQKDKYIQEYLINLNNPNAEQIKIIYDAILDYHKIALNDKSPDSLEIDDGLKKLLTLKSINQNQLNSAINILDQSGYLQFATTKQFKSTFRFLLSKEKFRDYIKKLINKELQEFLLILLQYYGLAPFTKEVTINFKEIETISGIMQNRISEYFERLFTIGILDLNLPSYHPRIEMLRERVKSSNLLINPEEINLKIDYAIEKLNAVISYSFTEKCRFSFILNYFGENFDYKCNKCDNCRNSVNKDFDEDNYLTEILLRTLKEYKGGLTYSRLTGIVTGKSKSFVAKSISTYQSCSHYSNDQIEKVISNIVTRKLAREIKGKLFFDPAEELTLSEDSIKSDEYESNLQLFNELREERRLASKKFSQDPEMICSDKTIKKLTQLKPKSPSSFLAVEGVNQRMFNKIGLEFIDIIKEHEKKYKEDSQSSDLPKHISQTYRLYKKGYTLSEISNLLKLPESILSIQFESIINYFPEDNFRDIIPAVEFHDVEEAIRLHGNDDKEIKRNLPNSISYAKIRIVKAILSNSRS